MATESKGHATNMRKLDNDHQAGSVIIHLKKCAVWRCLRRIDIHVFECQISLLIAEHHGVRAEFSKQFWLVGHESLWNNLVARNFEILHADRAYVNLTPAFCQRD